VACNPSTGTCETVPQPSATRLFIVTDPLCSACWAFEPELRRFLHEYGAGLNVRNVYGVLLPSWDGFADPSAGISGPADVGAHWQEMARHTGQPVDSSVWETDPVSSTVPAAMALLRVRDLTPEAEHAYLRRLRELVMAEGRTSPVRSTWRPPHGTAA